MDLRVFIFYISLWIAELSAQPIIPEDDIEPYQCPPDFNDWPTYNDGFSCIPCEGPHCPIFVMGEGVDHNGCPIFECLEEAPVCKNSTTSAKYYTDRCTVCDSCSELKQCVEYCLVEPRDCWSNITKELKTDGDSWTEDHGCKECSCREGNISCTQYWCKPLDCKPEEYITHENECCPTCPEKDADDFSYEAPREVFPESSSSIPVLNFTEGLSESTVFTDSTPSPVKSYTDDITSTMASSSEYFIETSTDSTTFFDLESSTDSTTSRFFNLDSSTNDQISEEPDFVSSTTEQTTEMYDISTEAVDRSTVVTDTPYIPELPPVINQTKEGGDSEPTRRSTKNDGIDESLTQENSNYYKWFIFPLVCLIGLLIFTCIVTYLKKLNKVEYKPTSTGTQQSQKDRPEEVYPFLMMLNAETINKETTRVECTKLQQ
ncbi:uncharacterized protein Dana_GF24123 [Drosophila ananassae]|uniref:VWFC domain-containing protein n=1 Tax=Drosophila ananassae TaxID=7217 RepID=B3M9R4_DROAN|nr:uncharacterized protein LOC6506757 [Drosophila ananassae]EDV40105.2 uncharacterized protein Dana_GF24123 [Drosophila ananassae]